MKRVPDKGALIRITLDSSWGNHKIKKGDLGIFTAFVVTHIGDNKENEAVLLDFFYVYLRRIGEKLAIPRKEFEIVVTKSEIEDL